LCCVCGSAAGLGGAAYYYLKQSPEAQVNLVETTQQVEPPQQGVPTEAIQPTQIVEPTAVVEATQAEETSATPNSNFSPTGTAVAANFQGLGVTQAAMVQFFNSGDVFDVGQPKTLQGQEVLTLTHKTLCVQMDCAAVSLAGPEDDLLAISVYVPTDPKDTLQTTTALTLLMDAVGQFSGPSQQFPTKVLSDLLQAQQAGADYQYSILNNGFSFTEEYIAKTHDAGVTITRPK